MPNWLFPGKALSKTTHLIYFIISTDIKRNQPLQQLNKYSWKSHGMMVINEYVNEIKTYYNCIENIQGEYQMVEAWKWRFFDRDSGEERTRAKHGEQKHPWKIYCNNPEDVTPEHRIQPLPCQTLILDIHTLCPSCTPGVVSNRTSERCCPGSIGSSSTMQRFRAVGGRGSR